MNSDIYTALKALADKYADNLKRQVDLRINEMRKDDTSHYLLYRVLGVTNDEGYLIDVYQNKGRFLYKYAGAFLEEAAMYCIKYKYPEAIKTRITNTSGNKPKSFEIDCLVDRFAHEIKWRDATTDGDHIIKEYTKVKAIKDNGLIPIRIMFYYPQRIQAIKIQDALETMYSGIGGAYYYADAAWQYIKEFTGIDLHANLKEIADSRS